MRKTNAAPSAPEKGVAFLVNELEESWNRYRKVVKVARADMTEASVHDLRVSLRRLDAAMDLAEPIAGKRSMQRTRKRAGKLRSGLSPLREVQVQLLALSDFVKTCPELEKFQRRLSKREESLLRTGKKDLNKQLPKLKAAF